MMWYLQKASQFLCLVLFFLKFQTSLSSSSSLTQLCSHDEASALIQFKNSFTIDYSSSWYCDEVVGIKSYPKTDSWKDGTDCCLWVGVICDGTKGHVISLDLSCSWLHGTIPSNSSLFNLPHLQKLNLAFNNFISSEMSPKFGEFASLVYLNLSNSYFAGQVPSQVSHLSKLVSLDLSHNYDQNFEKLTLERLVHNLSEVRHLFLDNIEMPSIDPNVFMNLSSSLRSFSLNDCGLRGIFPENAFHLPNLKMVNLGKNQNLSLSLPKFNLSSRLYFLDLSDMSFSRELFDSTGNLLSLKHLDLSQANISGPFPSSLINLTQLEVLHIEGNLLEGSVPDEVRAFPNVISLDLSSNLLYGTLPSWLYTIPSLKYMYLSDCQFSGHIKEFQHNSLQEISLENNKLQGDIPKVIGKLSSLKGLNLSHNNLSGCIPSSVGNLINIEWLDLSSNKLVGTIPQRLTNLASLSVFNVSENQLHGQIPQGKQFNTYGNDSYEGNNGLCGFPVSKGCSNSEPPPSNLLEDGDSKSIIAFGWKVVLIGYGCGVVFGLIMGYVVFQTGKPKWIVTVVEDRHGKRRKMTRIVNRRGGERRI
ncbi:hypothetical protein DITRI_Ditri01bG0173600 [Diplodiscus trichospermus]